MKMIKALSSFLLFFAILTLYRITASADIVGGNCGPNLAYRISDDGVLTISGEGTMYGYSKQGPWGNNATSLIVEDGVSCITAYAFQNCTNLRSITIADSVYIIYEYAFSGCTGLTNIEIPDSVSLNNNVFSDCTGLTTATLFGTDIPKGTFAGCTSLKTVIMPNAQIIRDGAFSDCISLTDIIIPSNVSAICDGAFASCTNLRRIVLPDGIREIHDKAFYNCKSLSNVTIPKSTTHLGKSVFYNCVNLTSAIILNPNINLYYYFNPMVQVVPDDPFINVNSDFKLIVYQDSTAYNYAINNNIPYIIIGSQGIPDSILPNSMKTVEDQAFEGIASMNVYISDSCINIGSHAFANSGLVKIRIPAQCTIEDNAFEGCNDLTVFGTIGSPAEMYCNSHENCTFVPEE